MNLHIASARRKLDWAEVRFHELQSAVNAYKVKHFKSTTVKANRESRTFVNLSDIATVSVVDHSSPIPLIAGDVVGNLSAALDHVHRAIGDDRKPNKSRADIDKATVDWPRGFPVPLRNTPHDLQWQEMIWRSVAHSKRWIGAAALIEQLYSDVTEENWPEHAANKIRAIANSDKHATTVGLRRETTFVPEIPGDADIKLRSAVIEYNAAIVALIDETADDNGKRGADAIAALMLHDDVQLTSPVEVFREHPAKTPLLAEVAEMIRFVAETIDAYEEIFDPS